MINPDKNEKILGAIVSLDGNPDWEMIRNWLKESLDEAYIESSRPRQEISMYPFNAGRVYELFDLAAYLDAGKSRKALDAIRRGKGR